MAQDSEILTESHLRDMHGNSSMSLQSCTRAYANVRPIHFPRHSLPRRGEIYCWQFVCVSAVRTYRASVVRKRGMFLSAVRALVRCSGRSMVGKWRERESCDPWDGKVPAVAEIGELSWGSRYPERIVVLKK